MATTTDSAFRSWSNPSSPYKKFKLDSDSEDSNSYDPPSYELSSGIKNVHQMWQEYTAGILGYPSPWSVRTVMAQRKQDYETVPFRRNVCDLIFYLMDQGKSESEAVDEVEQMRMANRWTFLQLHQKAESILSPEGAQSTTVDNQSDDDEFLDSKPAARRNPDSPNPYEIELERQRREALAQVYANQIPTNPPQWVDPTDPVVFDVDSHDEAEVERTTKPPAPTVINISSDDETHTVQAPRRRKRLKPPPVVINLAADDEDSEIDEEPSTTHHVSTAIASTPTVIDLASDEDAVDSDRTAHHRN